MNTVQRFLATMMLGGMSLAMVPLASAEEASSEADVSVRANMRLELKACNEKETAEERRTCAQAVYETYKDTLPSMGERMRRGIGRILPPVLQEQMKNCKETETKDGRKECKKTAREDFKNARTELRDGLKEACGNITDPAERRTCVQTYTEEHNVDGYRMRKPVRKTLRAIRHSPQEIRDQLKACRDEYDNDFAGFKTCIEEIRASIKANVEIETEDDQ